MLPLYNIRVGGRADRSVTQVTVAPTDRRWRASGVGITWLTLPNVVGIKSLYACSKEGSSMKKVVVTGGWNSLAMPRRYIESTKIANEGVKLD
ncbi:MAG: hypothetical protein ACYDBJ_25985 [Aggregatilineales bacterium]